MTYILPVTLYTFGNKKSPRPPRPNIDIAVENYIVKPTQPPTGASTFADIKYAPLTRHYYRIDISGAGTMRYLKSFKDAIYRVSTLFFGEV